jgi:hypothetical protein
MTLKAVSSLTAGGSVMLGSFLMKLRIMLMLTTLLPVLLSSDHLILEERADQLQQFEPVCEVFSLGGLYAHPAQALAGCYRQHALNSNYSNSQLADTPTYTLQTMSPMKGKVNVVMIDVFGIEY